MTTRNRDRFVKVDANDPAAVSRARALIGLLYRVCVNGRRSPLHQIRKSVRFRELETIFAHVWRGLELPDDEAGRIDLHIAACHLWHLSRGRGPVAAITAWSSMWAPWCGEEELAALIKRVEAAPRKWEADELAHELGLTFAVRQDLAITTIGSVDFDKAARKRRRGDLSKKRSAAWRRKQGAVSRADYLAKSDSRTKPWEALGISKRTYQRRKAREVRVGASPNAAI